ncbi:MAG TPA: Sec-independent protein translocase subunit TatA [Diaminobutyricibacter sp.]|jgi:sec-independent protein translocase protein TatA|uniref:Sec-independent protein translocase subunit TatA n=1 Tax=Leifsonia sp. McL0618 TaxID=3415677 RepID=UPI00338AE8CC
MFGNGLTGWHLLIILAVILLLFGAPKLPGLAKSLGQSMRIFRGEVKAMKEDDAAPSNTTESTGDTTAAPTDASVSRPASTSTEPHPKP